MLWQEESGAGTGGCRVPTDCRSSDGFARAARSAGVFGSNPFDPTAAGATRPHHFARGRWRARACECSGTRRLAQDGAVSAQTVATGGRRAVGRRAARRCAALGSPCNVHARADLRAGCHDVREAVGERTTHQPLEPARDCRRSDATWRYPEHLAALCGAFFKKEADLEPPIAPSPSTR